MASDLLTRPKNSTCTSLAHWNPLQSASQPRLYCLFWRSRTEGLKTEGERVSFFSALPHFFAFLSVWMVLFGPHRNSSVTVYALDGGWGGRWDVWQGGTKQWRYLRNAFSSSLLWGRLCRKSVKVSCLATLQKSARAPLLSGACNPKLGKALFSSF